VPRSVVTLNDVADSSLFSIITEEQRIQGEPQETSTVPPANPANVSPLGDNYREGTAAP